MTTMSFEYIEVLYNRKRQHSSLGYKSPIRFLDDWLKRGDFKTVATSRRVFHDIIGELEKTNSPTLSKISQ